MSFRNIRAHIEGWIVTDNAWQRRMEEAAERRDALNRDIFCAIGRTLIGEEAIPGFSAAPGDSMDEQLPAVAPSIPIGPEDDAAFIIEIRRKLQ